ncbi:MAG: UvrD-helicase domain-containing protein [Fibrobacterota bacterium]
MGRVSPARARIHRLIEALSDRYFAWSPIEQNPSGLPDFWIVEEATLRCLHLLVSDATEEQARGPGLFEEASTWKSPSQTESLRVNAAKEVLGAEYGTGAVLFPNAPADMIERSLAGWPRAGSESCRPAVFPDWIESNLSLPLDASRLREIRTLYCPETVLRPSQVMRQNPSEPIIPRFLTWKQEEILKTDLDATAEGRQTAGDFGLLVVQGVAGSGKSLILLHRALLLSRLARQSRILVLTCNKPLQVELRRRFQELSGGNSLVEFLTYHGFCLKRWPDENRPRVLDGSARRVRLDEALVALKRPLLLRKHLEEELAWIYDHGFVDEDAYAKTPRRGRGFRMDGELRSAIWTASVKFRELCACEGMADWNLLPLWFRDALQDRDVQSYDAILIDEAQFFAPVWFDAIRKFLAPRGHLFLAADPTQGFLRKGTSWRSLGLSVHGKSRHLDRSHRSTRPIMELAWRVWNNRCETTDSDIVVPHLDGMADGPAPVWYRFPDTRTEHAWIEDQVASFVESNGSPRHLLVLHNDWSGASDLRDRLAERIGPERVADARDSSKDSAVRVCQLNSATGLESPVVFVVGAQGIFEREGSPDLDAEGKSQARDEATRKFYMALTRAGWRLVVTSSAALPDEIASCFEPSPHP